MATEAHELIRRKLNFEKISFYPDSALGHRYGSCFKVVKQNLELFDEFNKDHELLKGRN